MVGIVETVKMLGIVEMVEIVQTNMSQPFGLPVLL